MRTEGAVPRQRRSSRRKDAVDPHRKPRRRAVPRPTRSQIPAAGAEAEERRIGHALPERRAGRQARSIEPVAAQAGATPICSDCHDLRGTGFQPVIFPLHGLQTRATMTPIVLHHGLILPGNVRVGPVTIGSFVGIDRVLAERGYPLVLTQVHPTAGVAQRAGAAQEAHPRAAPHDRARRRTSPRRR